jgi:HPt (histidine-containing phosphotransfer) domain-containing protein
MSPPITAPINALGLGDRQRFVLPKADLASLLNQTQLPSPINWPALVQHCLGNTAFALELLSEFDSTGHERMAELNRCVATSDFVAVAESAHSLRGVAGILAAERLSELASELEGAVPTRDLTRVSSLAERLQTEMHRCLLEIPKILAGPHSR